MGELPGVRGRVALGGPHPGPRRPEDRAGWTAGAWDVPPRRGEGGVVVRRMSGGFGFSRPTRAVSPPAHWGARPEVHSRRSATAMSDRGRKVLAVSLAGLSLVIVLGLGALGVFAPVGRSRGTPGPTLVAPPSDTRPGGPVTSATLVKAEGRAIRKGQVVFDGDAPTAPPSQEPQPQRPQPQPRRDWTNSIGMKLARIEPGSFLMGSTDGTGDEDEHPQHEVRITRPFYLGVTEVTQGNTRP